MFGASQLSAPHLCIDAAGNTLTLSGECGGAAAQTLKQAIDRVMAGAPGEVAIDMTGVTFCDTNGFVVLARAAQLLRIRGFDLRVTVQAGSQAERHLRVSCLDNFMSVVSTDGAETDETLAEKERAEIELHEGLLGE